MSKSKAGAPQGNNNAEIWTEEKAIDFLNEAIEKAKEVDDEGNRKYDFIGELASDMDTYREIFDYLAGKFNKAKELRSILKSHIEANCFSSAKKGKIVPSLGIINLKSNHGWTDRVDQTTKGESLTSDEPIAITFKKKRK